MSFFWEYLGARTTIWGLGLVGSLLAFLLLAALAWFLLVGAAFVAFIWYLTIVAIWTLDSGRLPNGGLRFGSYFAPRFLEVRWAGTTTLGERAFLIFVAQFGILIGAAALLLANPAAALLVALVGLLPLPTFLDPRKTGYAPTRSQVNLRSWIVDSSDGLHGPMEAQSEEFHGCRSVRKSRRLMCAQNARTFPSAPSLAEAAEHAGRPGAVTKTRKVRS